MKKNLLIYFIITFIVIFILSSCDDLPSGSFENLSITINSIDFTESSEYDFGFAEPETGSKTSTVIIKNNHDAAVTVVSVSIDDSDNYSFTGPDLPFQTESGQSAEVTLTYSPQSSGTHSATVSIIMDTSSEPFTIDLTGKGNYAPTAKFGIQVTGAGETAANGFYTRTGFHTADSDTRPLYTKNGTENYYCYIYPYDGDLWAIDNTLTAGLDNNPAPQYSVHEYPSMMVPPDTNWSVETTGTSPAPTVVRYDITGTEAASSQTLTANYLYSDRDGDSEYAEGTAYQWYRSSSADGVYTAITGAVSKTYLPVNDSGYYIKVRVTPSAAAGTATGVPVLSSATIQIIEIINDNINY